MRTCERWRWCFHCNSSVRYLTITCTYLSMYGRFFSLYHNAVSSRVKELAFEDLEANEIVSLLTWVLNTYKRYFYTFCVSEFVLLIVCNTMSSFYNSCLQLIQFKLLISKCESRWVFLTVFYGLRKIQKPVLHQLLCEIFWLVWDLHNKYFLICFVKLSSTSLLEEQQLFPQCVV